MLKVITIDGPVGAGKSAVARALAKRLGYFHLDTGAMYRALTLEAMNQGVNLTDQAALTSLAHQTQIELDYANDELRVYCNGEDVTQQIRSPEVSANTSPVADVIGVRKRMVELQRAFAKDKNVVTEGRDQGTVVFPDASWKFYLEASLTERARRRAKQLQEQNSNADLEQVKKETAERDARDRSRPYGPLRVAPNAIVIDSTNLSETQVVELMASFLAESGGE